MGPCTCRSGVIFLKTFINFRRHDFQFAIFFFVRRHVTKFLPNEVYKNGNNPQATAISVFGKSTIAGRQL